MYKAVDLEYCRKRNHHFRSFHSDKTPLKVNLLCEECSRDGKTAIVAYGTDVGSWGKWKRKPQREDNQPF